MSGHGEKLSRKQERAIAALLTEPTVEAAAQAAGVAASTLRRWLKVPAFKLAYRQAREQALSLAIGHLQEAAVAAVAALRETLTKESGSPKVAAARAILEQAHKGAELLDLFDRMAELEQRVKAQPEPAAPQRKPVH